MWVSRILEATQHDSLNLSMPWEWIEDELDTRLPGDYKELCEAFGCGVFSESIQVLSVDPGQALDLVVQWKGFVADALESGDESDPLLEPYRIYAPGKGGLIPWGSGESGDEFYWLTDSLSPDDWPTLARVADSVNWHRFEMPMSEFLFRAIAEPDFRPFSVAHAMHTPSFTPVDS